MTNAELIAEIRKAGDIEMPVLNGSDVTHLIIRKSDLLALLADHEPDAEARWAFTPQTVGEVRRLDVA